MIAAAAALLAAPSLSAQIVNERTGDEFGSLNQAITAAETGDVLLVTKSINLSAVSNPGEKTLTISGATPDVKIFQVANASGEYKQMFQVNNAAGNLTVSNLTLIGAEAVTTVNLSQVSAGQLTLRDVTVDGFKSTVTTGAIRINNNAEAVTLDNVRFINSGLPEATPYDVLLANTATLDIQGDTQLNLRLNSNTSFFNAAGFTSPTPLNVYVADNRSVGAKTVEGCDDVLKFNLITATEKVRMLAPGADGCLNTVAYQPVLLINEADGTKTGTGYSSLSGAISAANDGANLILLNESVDFDTNIAGKSLNINRGG